MQLTIKIDDKAAKILIKKHVDKALNLRPFFSDFYAYMLSRTMLTFRSLKNGGSFRGVTWKPFADQYTRKDGTIIPAVGGVRKVRGQGVVKGRLRGKGKNEADRVTSQSNLLRHRGILSAAALNDMTMSRSVMTMNTNVEYAEYQNSMRPFQFFEIPADENMANRLFIRHLSNG